MRVGKKKGNKTYYYAATSGRVDGNSRIVMQALQLVARRQVEVREIPDPPDPGPGEVAVWVRAVGVCGSDTHFSLELTKKGEW